MTIKPTTAHFAAALEMAGEDLFTSPLGFIKGLKTITSETGLNASQAWCFLTRQQIERVYQGQDLKGVASAAMAKPKNVDGTDSAEMTEFKRAIAQARNEDNQSWGLIGVRAERPEGLVRRLYKEQTGRHSQGLRIGKGGRWLLNDQVLYNGDRKASGIALAASMRRPEFHAFALRLDAIEAEEGDLTTKSHEELVQMAKAMKVGAGGKKEALIFRIREAMAEAEAPEAEAEEEVTEEA